MVTQIVHRSRSPALLALSLMSWLVFSHAANAQLTSATDHPQFDVIALRKLADTRPEWGGMRHTAGLIETPRDTLRELIALAYDTQPEQIAGAPGWSDTIRYDIVLRTQEPMLNGPFQGEGSALRMLQTLLVERFNLIFHREQRSLSAAALMVGPNGIKMKDAQRQTTDWQGIELTPGRLLGRGAPMMRLTSIIALSTGETVLDQTGLTGIYDFDAQWRPNAESLTAHRWHYLGENPPVSSRTSMTSGSSLEEALEHDLGLVLERPKSRDVDFIVIDRVELPAET